MRSASLVLALALAASALDVRILDMNEEVTTGTAIAVEGDDLVVTLADGTKKPIPCDTVVEITFPANNGAATATPQVEVVLHNGDVIRGNVTGGDSEKISLAAGEMGTMDIDLGKVSRVLVLTDNNKEKVPADASAPEDMDRLYLTNQDTDRGFPDDEAETPVTPDGITFKSMRKPEEPKTVTYAWKEIAGWYISGGEAVKVPPALIATVVCSGGTRLTGNVVAVAGQTLTLNHLVVGMIPVPVAAVRAIYFVNGRVTYLSDLDPIAVRERPHIYDEARPETSMFPYRRDVAVISGEPLNIKGREFRKGLGVHGFCALEYELKHDYTRFCASIGLDKTAVIADNVGGSVVFQVFEGPLERIGPALSLYAPHVKDWKALCSRLKGSKRFWGLVDDDSKKVIEEVASAEEATEAETTVVMVAVNAALAKDDLYDEDAFPAGSLAEDAQAILDKDAAKRTPLEVDRLNRRCLEQVAGDSIIHVPQLPKRLYDSGLVRYGDDAKDISIPLDGVDSIVLVVRCGMEGDIFDGDEGDRADWGGARFIK